MFRKTLSLFLSVVVTVSVFSQVNESKNLEAFRAELSQFFSKVDHYSPSMMVDLAGDLTALENLQSSIQNLDEEKLLALKQKFDLVPGWQTAPEVLAAVMPDDYLVQVSDISTMISDHFDEMEQFRMDMESVFGLLKLASAEQLKALKLSELSLDSRLAYVNDMTYKELTIFHAGLEKSGSLENLTELIRNPEMANYLSGIRDLARNGLDETAEQALETFRTETRALITGLEMLAPQDPKYHGLRNSLSAMNAEQLYLVQGQLKDLQLHKGIIDLGKNGPLDEAAKVELEAYRSDLVRLFGHMENESVIEAIQAATPEQLMVLRSGYQMNRGFKGQQLALNGIYDDGFQAQMRALIANENFNSNQDLFRGQMVARFSNESLMITAKDREQALRVIKEMPATALTPLMALYEGRSEAEQAELTLSLVNPVMGYTQNVLGKSCRDSLDLGLTDVCLDWLTNPLRSAIESATSLANDALAQIDTLSQSLPQIVDQVVNAIPNSIQSVLSTVTNLPSTIQNFFTGLVNEVFGGFDLEELMGRFGIEGEYWNSIPELPQLPCPSEGTYIPLFGRVGSADASSKFNLYLWIFEEILDMLPETEISLSYTVALKTAFASIKYLGLCLEEAAAAVEERETMAYRANVTARQIGTLDALGRTLNNIADLDRDVAVVNGNLAAARNAIQSDIANLDGDVVRLQSSVNTNIAKTDAIQAYLDYHLDVKVTTRATQVSLDEFRDFMTNRINRFSDETTANFNQAFEMLRDQKYTTLRLHIEMNLVNPQPVAQFQLPEDFGGRLEMVREIVLETIQMNQGMGENMKNSLREFQNGDESYDLGDYKDAYESYAKAYRESTKTTKGNKENGNGK